MKKTVLTLGLVLFSVVALAQNLKPASGSNVEITTLSQPLNSNTNTLSGTSSSSPRQFSPNGVVRCYTAEHHKEMQQNRLAPTDDVFENWIAPKIQELKNARLANPNQTHAVITIPVVVHVIHNGDAYGTGENIRDEQVLSQIQVMNEDFRRIVGTPGFGAGVDVEIEFCLAQSDPNGNPTTGINRVNLGIASWDRANVEGNLKPNTSWDPNNYLNMWTCRFGGDLNGVLGYAQFPSASGLAGMPANGGGAGTDGVIMAFNAFGSSDIYPAGSYLAPYDKGRTTTHEVGHWLGLRHIWGDGNCTVDDFCADTPTAAAPNYNCVLVNSCNDGPGDLPDQVENYMDYTNDTCMNIFTQNQKERMLVVMANSPRRVSLVNSTKCLAPAPIIQFGNPTGSVIEQTNCNFTDYNFPVTIMRPATANAVVTFVVSGGTATQGIDYAIVNPSVTFPSGNMASQNLTIRVFNDGIIEPNETIQIGLSLNANGGDAVLNAGASSMTITITNDDFAPVSTQVVNLLTEDFEDLTGWLVLDGDGDGRNWGIVNGLEGLGTAPNTISGRAGFSAKRLNYFGTNSTVNPNNYLISPQIAIPAGATNVDLSFITAAYDDGGPVRNAGNLLVYFTTDITNQTTIQNGTVVQTALVINENTSQLRTYNLSALAGQTGYLVFRHNNATADNVGLLLIDNVQLNATVSVEVQTEVNFPTAYNALLNQSGIMYTSDLSTGRVMSGILNTSGFDYGCTTIHVDRSNNSTGNPTSLFTDAIATNAVMSKTFRVTTTNDTPTGNYTISFYFTESEVAAWELATGKSRNELHVIKVINNPVSSVNTSNVNLFSIEYQPVVIGSFGSNVVFEAQFSSLLDGGYAIGPLGLINCGDVTTVWNGSSWSNGAPFDKLVAVFDADYNTGLNGSLSCCSLVVNSGNLVTIDADTYISVVGDITINGNLEVSNNGSLIQVDNDALNTGNISYERTVAVRKNDYVYWSSPIDNFNSSGISPNTSSSFIFKWSSLVVNANGGQGNWLNAANETMVRGRGYIVKGPDNFTNTAQNFTAEFVNGVPNNGVITVPVSRGNYQGADYTGTNSTTITRFSDNWNLIGNPYPSAINVLDFLNLNSNIEGAVRLWTHSTLPSSAIASPFYGTAVSNYSPADYITYNGVGTVSGPNGFNGFIAGAQGFFVLMNDGATTTENVIFNNSLRSASYANNQFYRTTSTENSVIEASRIWLDIVAENNVSDRTLIGYVAGATNQKDRLFDAFTTVGNSMKIYSLINSDKMTIQGRELPFNPNDEVQLGYAAPASGIYSIGIAAIDGLFASNQNIYLEDTQLGIIHDLRQSAYSFSTNAGENNTRFILRYTNETLGNGDFTLNNDVLVVSNQNIKVVSSSIAMTNVKIYNVLGQLLLNSNTINSNTFETSSIQKNNTTLLVQITLENGVTMTKKTVF